MLQDKIDWLQRDFDRFKVNFQNELDKLKSTNKSKIKLGEICKLIYQVRAIGLEPQKIVISPDVDVTMWNPNWTTKGYNSYLFGIPLEVKADGHNEIAIVSKKIDG